MSTTEVQSPQATFAGSVLQLDGVGKSFGPVTALRNVTLNIGRSETVAIIGPSGSGKTTLLRCINFLVPYDKGTIRLLGQLVGYRELTDGTRKVASEKEINRTRTKIGFVFQRFNLFPHRTALENVMEGPVYVLKVPRKTARVAAMAALERVGLQDKVNSYPYELSGGQQQRVGIARALCMEPDVLLCDEITSALDPELVAEVLGVIRELASAGNTLVLVTHELEFARECADRVVFMESGSILVDMPSQKFFEAPKNARIASYLQRLQPRGITG